MKAVKVLPGQCVVDLAVQYAGDAARAMEVAQLNDISITGLLMPGTFYVVPDDDGSKRSVLQLFVQPSYAPASEKECNTEINPGGIEFWAIEYDFKVS